MEDSPQSEPYNPRFLLPEGCKDIIDLLRLEQTGLGETSEINTKFICATEELRDTPSTIDLKELVTIQDLATALKISNEQIMMTLLRISLNPSSSISIDFNTANEVCVKYGIVATKVP